MLYLFFYILHLYTTGIVKLFKNTFIFDIFVGHEVKNVVQPFGITVWNVCFYFY